MGVYANREHTMLQAVISYCSATVPAAIVRRTLVDRDKSRARFEQKEYIRFPLSHLCLAKKKVE